MSSSFSSSSSSSFTSFCSYYSFSSCYPPPSHLPPPLNFLPPLHPTPSPPPPPFIVLLLFMTSRARLTSIPLDDICFPSPSITGPVSPLSQPPGSCLSLSFSSPLPFPQNLSSYSVLISPRSSASLRWAGHVMDDDRLSSTSDH